jgi:Zn-dependent protease with chaperone function
VWILHLGEAEASSSERALELTHQLLQAAASAGELRAVLGARSIEEFLRDAWVSRHPSTREAIEALRHALTSAR